MIGKFILPWFGGMPAVWTTCMLFFQMLLFGGYAYADLRARGAAEAGPSHGAGRGRARPLPMLPADAWKPAGSSAPPGKSCSC